MGPLRIPNGENGLIKSSTPNADDGPSLPDECNNNAIEDERFGDTVPCEDNDSFDTQVMHEDFETQPVDLYEDTEILYLAGETQVMDEFVLDEFMDTQLFDDFDNEADCVRDEQGAKRPQLLHGSKEFLGRNDDEAGAGEMEIHSCHEDNRGAKKETLSQNDDVVQRSGSVSKGFLAIRTASLRAAGLAAQKNVSKNAASGFGSTEFSSRSSNLQSSNEDGVISDLEAVDLEHDKQKEDEYGLSTGLKNKVARSLTKEFFMEDDVGYDGCNHSCSGELSTFPQIPACDNEVAGLSYVDSQEPGELSQANALEFVDRFLKINVTESDQDITDGNTIGETMSPETIAKGAQSLAQQALRRNSFAVASVFDWDDIHEDEGGGVFFTKKKEELFGTNSGARRSRTKSRNAQHHGSKGSQSLEKLINEKERQNMHEETTGLVHYGLKSVKSGKTSQCQLEEVNEKGDNCPDLDLPSCNEVLAAAPIVDANSMLDVGIDTQTAAEAMEVLSTGNLLAENNGSIRDDDHQNVSRKETAKSTLSKQSFVKKQPCRSKSDTTKSKRTSRISIESGEERKSFIASRTRSQHKVKASNIETVKPKLKGRRLSMNNISRVNETKSSHNLVNHDEKEAVCAFEGRRNSNESRPLERRNLQDKGSVSAALDRKTRQHKVVNHVNGTNDESSDSRAQRQCLDVVQTGSNKRKCSTRNDADFVNINAREETLDIPIVTDSSKIDRSSCRGKSLKEACNQVDDCGKGKPILEVFGGHETVFQSIMRRTRSKRSARCAEFPLDGKVLRSGVVASSKEASQLPSEKRQVGSSTVRSGLHIELEGSPIQLQNSSSTANMTPVNLKTPTTAVSPVCVGDEYLTPFKKRCLQRELHGLTSSEPKYTPSFKDSRQRRDLSSVRVLFSQHLDENIIRKQKKVLSRLGIPVASSILESTHFVTDMFVRTRNMLEAIARGKQVVTHLWLESCGQSNCFIDEKNYILRDAKKEKEMGFSMPNSLARAIHYPLLEGRRVLITPNTKPSKEIISGLVKAVCGQAIERLCRTMSKNNRLPDDLLVLSSEEDFQECLPLLEKGIAVYSSELLLNGIITQKLEYERYLIFADYVKRTRSTLWVKKNGHRFLPVSVTK